MKLPFNKNTIRVCLFVTSLLASSLGASSFASYVTLSSSLSSGVYQGPQQGTLSDFGQRLGARLTDVWQEVLGLVGNPGRSSSAFSSLVSDDVLTGKLNFTDNLSSAFGDVGEHPQARFISVLAEKGIVAGQHGKFYPDNYLRLYDLIKMTVDLYRYKAGYSLTGDDGLLQEGYFLGSLTLSNRYLATAARLGFLSHVSGNFLSMDDMQRFVYGQDIVQIVTNVSYQFSGMARVFPYGAQGYLTRGDAARYLVVAFDLQTTDGLQKTNSPFLDIYGHPFASHITTLANRGIVSSGAKYFYPDNYLHRYEFIIMAVNSYLVSRNISLPIRYFSGFSSSLLDVSGLSYAPFVYYAEDHDWLSYLTIQKRNQYYLLPNELISAHEIYTILSKITGKTFVYDTVTADTTFITRAQFASVLCDVFGFSLTQDIPVTSSGTGLVHQISTLLQIKDLLATL